MGNPIRYFIDENRIQTGKIEFLVKENKFIVSTYEEYGRMKVHYPYLQIDIYGAPDVILEYTNGNNTKNEFVRVNQLRLKNVSLTNIEPDMENLDSKKYISTYKFEAFEENEIYFSSSINDRLNVPLGKFFGMNEEDLKKYDEKNTCQIQTFTRS